MVHFAQSIWLWAIAGIIVPVIIHLWNVKQGKTLKVGSIAFLTESAKAHSRSLKLSELLLLLVRCLLLIVLAVMLGKPIYIKQVNLVKEKGWLLIEGQNVKEAYNKFQLKIDSLLNTGYTFHYFNKGFKEVKFKEALKMEYDSSKDSNEPYWTLLKDLNRQIPAKLPVVLFADNSLSRFKGTRPDVALNLRWHIYFSNDSTSTWIEKAYQTTKDSICVIIGHSNAAGIYYTPHNIAQYASNEKFDVIVQQGETTVTYKDNSAIRTGNTVKVDTSIAAIIIYTDKFGADAKYLKAALDAIRDFTKHKIKTSVVTSIESIPGKYNWLFWLSENELPSPLEKSKVFVYEKGKVLSVHSPVLTSDKSDGNSIEDLQVFKMIENKRTEKLYPLWKNGYGDAILSLDKNDSVYHFYSRFNPQWNSLTWSGKFPQIIYNLIFNQNNQLTATGALDKRVIDEQQIQPTFVDEREMLPKENLSHKTDLTKTCWVIAFLLFFLERIITYKTKKGEVYG